MRQKQHLPLKAEQTATLPRVDVDALVATLKYYVDDEVCHIRLKEPALCRQCQGQPCLAFCPVGVYRLDRQGQIIVSYQSCIECGSCRVACPHANIDWRLPRGGYGVAYKFG